MGEPAFDIAFCLNHMLLKCLWTPVATSGFLDCFEALAGAYLDGGELGAAGCHRGADRAVAAGLVPGAGRWQIAG